MTTVEWYVDWLKERNPEWTDEQRLEIATGFANQQLPVTKSATVGEEPAADEEPTPEDVREQKRKAERLLNGYIGNLFKEAGE
jgi:hypothetical protein